MADAEIQGMLKTALEKLESKPSTLLDLIVTPAAGAGAGAAADRGSNGGCDPAVAEALTRFAEERGGESVRVQSDAVQIRLPAGEVRNLASSGLAAAVRMARLARMH